MVVNFWLSITKLCTFLDLTAFYMFIYIKGNQNARLHQFQLKRASAIGGPLIIFKKKYIYNKYILLIHLTATSKVDFLFFSKAGPDSNIQVFTLTLLEQTHKVTIII